MIKSIRFQNFKALRDATLPLGPFTLIVGPNGSGKSTVMQALRFAAVPNGTEYDLNKLLTVGVDRKVDTEVRITIDWVLNGLEVSTESGVRENRVFGTPTNSPSLSAFESKQSAWRALKSFRVFSFDANAIASAVDTAPHPQLGEDGLNLAAVLDRLRDTHPEKFEDFNREFHRWLPEFDRVLFDIPDKGKKTFLVRTTVGHHHLPASELSQGVLFALAFLALAYLPEPPYIVGFEEPDRGIHPRLLRDIRDAMYRLAFPENYGEKRKPVQVIATTHSPYLLDFYKEQPEQIVISHKDKLGVHFERLADKPHLDEILEGAPLGDIWLTGILGGVPSTP
ncbi:MAG TPA: AAA family ATPase [Pyrinomonadaceae bacterium]|nr:AAA family ATPase [Pyrinomonadaceae bacterium]